MTFENIPGFIIGVILFFFASGVLGGLVAGRNRWFVLGTIAVGGLMTVPLVKLMQPHGCPGGECIADVILLFFLGPIGFFGAGLVTGGMLSALVLIVKSSVRMRQP